MVQGYYTLDEAARILGMDAERLNQMAQRREIRAFADRGTWRFRTQDIEEMARRLGMGSNPDLQLGEADRPKPASSVKPRSGAKAQADEGDFDFSGPSQRDPSVIDHEIVIESPSSHKSGRKSGALSPSPKPGSDSDVHLVFDVGGDLPIGSDSDVKLEESGPSRSSVQRKSGPTPETPKSGPRKKTPPPGSRSIDSGVRLVPMEEDNALPLGQIPPFSSGTDSDIRLAPDKGRAAPSDEQLAQTTEDINLDEELRRAEELAQGKKPRSKVKRKTDVKLQQHSPVAGHDPAATEFELPKPKSGVKGPASGVKGPGSGVKGPGSKVKKDDTVNLRLDQVEEAELGLGGLDEPGEISGSTKVSGINLSAPADSGINLAKEPSSDSVEFELSLEPDSTPRPAQEAPEVDSSGEFELTLDEEGGVGAADEDATAHEGSADKDIFETDFEAPAIGEDAAGKGVSLEEGDTDLESSDFDLSLGDEDSGSQVVALEEEEADEGAATVAHKARSSAPASEQEETDEIDELLAEDEVEELPADEEEEEFRPRRAVAAAPAEWGVLPALILMPSVVITLLVCLMSFELLHTMWGYHYPSNRPSAWLVKTFAGMIGEKVAD